MSKGKTGFKQASAKEMQEKLYQDALKRYIQTGAAQPAADSRSVEERAAELWKERSPAAAQQLADYSAYKATGASGLTRNAAQQLVGKAFYTPDKLEGSNPEAIARAYLDQQGYINLHKNEGQWDMEGNSPSMWSDEYLAQSLENLQRSLAQSRAADEDWENTQAEKMAAYEKAAANAERWKQLYGEKDRGYAGETMGDNVPNTTNIPVEEAARWYNWLMADYLLGDQAVPFDMEALNAKYDAMTDEQYYAEEARLDEQFQGLDWESLINPVMPAYESQTETIEKALAEAEKEEKFRYNYRAYKQLADKSQGTLNLEKYYKDNIEGYDPQVYDAEWMADLVYFINHQGGSGQQFNLTQMLNDNAFEGIVSDLFGYSLDADARKVESYYSKGYNLLTPEEIVIYNDLYGVMPEVAQGFLDLIQDKLLERRYAVKQAETEVISQNGTLGAAAALMTPAMNVLNATQVPQQIYEAATGKDSPYSSAYDLANISSGVRQAQSDVLGEVEWANKLGTIGGNNILQNLYGGAMSAADNIARIAAGGYGGALTLAGLGSTSGALQEAATREDMSGAAKVTQGLAAGIAEVLTEKIGLDKLFDTSTSNAFKYLKNAIGAEVGEEVLNELGTEGIDYIIAQVFGHEAEIRSGGERAEDVLNTVVQTAISSLLMGGGGAISQAAENRATGKAISTQGDVEAVVNIGLEMGEGTQSNAIAKRIKENLDKKKKISLGQLGRLTRQLEEDIGAEGSKITNQVMEEAIEERLVELGSTREAAKKNAVAVRKTAGGQKLTISERAAVEWDDNATQVVKELSREISAEDEGRVGTGWRVELEGKALEATESIRQRGQKLVEARVKSKTEEDVQKAVEAAQKKTKGKNAKDKNLTVKEVAYATNEGEVRGAFQRFEMKDGAVKAVVKTGDKEAVVAISDLTDEGGAGTAAIIEYTAQAYHDMSAEEANSMMQAYQTVGGNVAKFITDFEKVYASGFADIDMPSTSLPEGVAKIAYEQAKQEGEKAETERVAKAKRLRESTKGSVAWLGLVEDNSAIRGAGDQKALSEAMTGMTESQRSTVEVVKAMAEELRVNIVLYESAAKNISKLANGKYDSGIHTLYIDVNSGAASEAGIQSGKETNTLGFAMMRTLGHELTHHIESTNAEGYAQYKTAVKKQLQENGQSWAELVRKKIEASVVEGRKLTRMGAEAEVVADASEYMLQESIFTKKLDSGLYAKVKTFVQSFMEKVREIFTHITGEHRESAALRKVIDGVKQYTGNLQQLWDAALGETIQGESELGAAAGDVTEAVEDVQFSLRDSSGNEIALGNDEVQENKTYVANMEPVVVLTGNPMAKESGIDFYTGGTAYFQSIGGSAQNDVLGTVVLNEKGIRHLINRKLTWRKTALLRAVKPVIEQGRILHVENDHNNKDTAVIGAVVQLDGQNYYMGVVVSQNDQRNNQYELHDAVIVQIEKKSADALTKTPSADKNQTRRGIGNSSIAIILSDLANYNTKFAEEEQFSPRDLTKTEQFKRWFGDSKVVNEDGSPKVMYHGTPYGGFTVFKGWQYFTDNKEYADQYQNPSASSIRGRYDPATAPQTYEVYLQVKKPFDTRDPKARKLWQDEFYGNYSRTPLSERGLPDWTDGIDLVDFIEENGYDYDAIILDEGGVGGYGDEVKDRGVSVVVRDATQIKSATDNVGTFDPENPDIRYSTRDLPDTVSIREYLGAMKPTSRMTETEKDLLSRYQKKLADLQEKERLAAEQDAILKEAHGDELLKAKNRYQIYRQQANRMARELARLERAEGFVGIMATSQTIVNEYLSGATGSVADAQEALETEIKGLTDRLKVISSTVEGAAQGQRNAFARGLFSQSELNRAAKQLKDGYNSRMSAKAIADRLALAYGEIYANEGAEGAKRFAEAAKGLAQDILDSSRYRYRSETLSTIAEELPTISLTETDLQEIRNAGMTITEYKRGLTPYVKVVEGASDLSSYATSAEAFGGQIARILGTDTEGDLAMALYNVIQAERASEGASTFEGMSESESLGAVLADVMSVNLPLSGNSEAISYLRKELKKYAGENEEIAQAIDNAIQSASKATARASAVWREAVKAQGIAHQAVEYYRALEEQRRLIELQEQKEMLTEQLKSDAAKKLGEKVEAQRQEYREREQKARAYRQTRDEVNKLRRSIGRKVKRLNALRIRETDQKHVPQELQHMADVVMQTFTESSLSKLAFAPQKTASLARRYRQLQELESDMTYYWDDEIETDIENLQALSEAYTALTTKEDGSPARYHSLEGVELETEILQGVDAIVSNVMRMIDAGNDQFLTQRNETFDAYATQTGEDLLKHADAKVLKGKAGDAQMALDEMFRTGNMTPIYFFEQLKNGRIMEVYDAIRRGQTEYAQIIRECQGFVQQAKEKHHYGSWAGEGKLTMQTSQKHQITLSREQAMWVYATAKREQSNKLYQTEHLLYGGFQYKDTSSTGEGVFRETDKPHQLDAADVAKIGNWLTAEQKAYADEVVGFLSTTMADYGNAASMEMFGYKKFLESYYFPFQTAAAQRFQRGDEGASGESAGTGRVKNSGFTKKLQHKANATLVMDDFTTVAVDHMQKMATYAAMVQPIEKMKRLMNHKVMERDGTTQTIRALIGQKYGKAQQAYLQDFLKDLNGAAQGDNRATKGVDYLVGAFKRGAVLASASVVLQQPTAMARAMAMVNPKYFVTNPFYRPSKGVWDKMMNHSGTAIIKDMGKFDVGLGLTASEYISDEHLKPWEAYRRLKEESKLKGGVAAYKRFMDWLTAAPGKADQWTWGLIWQAVEKEVAAQHPNMDTGSEAFLDLVGQRFDDVIDHTQVYDSVLTRSNLMRSKNALHKMATSFMSEPTLSINMIYNALTGEHSGKKRAAIIGSVMASQVLAGAMAALVQAWNDDKDERNWLEKYADRAAGNVLDNINVFGMVPYISDFISLCQGYEVERADMSVVSTLIKYTTGFWNKLSNGETLTLKDWENFAGNWANLTGVPAKNILREVRRTINAVTKTDWSMPTASNVGYAMAENLGVFYSSKNTEYYERLTSAMLKGDKALAEDLRTYMLTSKMVTEETLQSGVKTALKNLYTDGKLEAEEARAFLKDNGLVEDEDSAYWEVDKWTWMQETGGKAGDYRKYEDFYAAVESGVDLKAVIQTYLDNGVAAKTLAGNITEEYKPRMKELYKTNRAEYANLQARILTAYQVLGYDRNKKLKDIQKWLEEP